MEKEYLRFYIKTRALLEIAPVTIHEELIGAYGQDVVSYATVQRWSKSVREGKMNIEDQPRSGRPITETTEENIRLVQGIIDEDPRCTYDDLIEETSLSRGTLERIINDHLKLKKITSRWVPHELTPEQKAFRVKLCQENLDKFRHNSWRLCDVMTGDETWIYLRQIGRKAANATWVGEGQSAGTIVRRNQHEPKVLYSLFFKSNGPLLIHAVDKGKKVDRYYYIDRCLEPLIQELKRQRPLSGTHGMKLLHDGAGPHKAQEVKDYLKEEHINLIPHPAYSPDLAPCDFWLNDYIKSRLTNHDNEKSLHKAVTNIILNIPEKEYKKTFDKLLERYERCINNEGDYFEHLI